jgi:hypothetical protein|nr:hypothetical protein [uncultured Ruminococcus sp.]
MKKSLLLCLSLLLVVIMVGCNNSKGGEDALTVFDVNSSKVQIAYNNKTTTLTDDKQKEFVSLIKSIYKGTDVKDDSTTKYDMKIDFNIGNVVEISTALFLVSIFVWNKGISNYESAGS